MLLHFPAVAYLTSILVTSFCCFCCCVIIAIEMHIGCGNSWGGGGGCVCLGGGGVFPLYEPLYVCWGELFVYVYCVFVLCVLRGPVQVT